MCSVARLLQAQVPLTAARAALRKGHIQRGHWGRSEARAREEGVLFVDPEEDAPSDGDFGPGVLGVPLAPLDGYGRTAADARRARGPPAAVPGPSPFATAAEQGPTIVGGAARSAGMSAAERKALSAPDVLQAAAAAAADSAALPGQPKEGAQHRRMHHCSVLGKALPAVRNMEGGVWCPQSHRTRACNV